MVLCGSQRSGVNVSPAIGTDGTIYTVSRAHFDPTESFIVAANPDLTPKWAKPLGPLNDGCGFLLPIANNTTTPNSCSPGTSPGVDPTTNYPGFAVVFDQASSTPTVLPDGSILFAALDKYNFSRGHLLKFTSDGVFQGPAYSFGWDSTPAVYSHNGTYSIVIKDNHYPKQAYCYQQGNPVCTPAPDGPYYITQLDANLMVEWQFQNTTTDPQHLNGYEWCVNAPVIDSNGVVYVNSEDGNLYSIAQGNDGVTPQQKIFLKQAIGAAYTPLSVGPDGKLYVQNDGHLFVVGN
jgi:outer membrane protein assembly factor BamB